MPLYDGVCLSCGERQEVRSERALEDGEITLVSCVRCGKFEIKYKGAEKVKVNEISEKIDISNYGLVLRRKKWDIEQAKKELKKTVKIAVAVIELGESKKEKHLRRTKESIVAEIAQHTNYYRGKIYHILTEDTENEITAKHSKT